MDYNNGGLGTGGSGSIISMTFTATNNTTTGCSMVTRELKLTDGKGRIWNGGGQIDVMGNISPGQTLVANAEFDKLPVVTDPDNPYSLHMVLACNTSETMLYRVEQFYFEAVQEGSGPGVDNSTLEGALTELCDGIKYSNYDQVQGILTPDLQQKISTTTLINTFGEYLDCTFNTTNEPGNDAVSIVTLTKPNGQKDDYRFHLQRLSNSSAIEWEIQSWEKVKS
jgi:hypothetical protein